MGRILAWLIGAGLLAGVVAWSAGERIALLVLERVAPRMLQASALDELPDGLHVALCGAGSPLPDPRRSGPCVAVIAGKSLVLVDTGAGAARNLRRMNIGAGAIDAVLLTHFHSDHIDGLGETAMMRWVQSAHREPLPVHGPPGVEQVVEGFNRAYALDAGYRSEHHGPAVAPRGGEGMRALGFDPPADGSTVLVLERAGLRVYAFSVDHDPVTPAVGYRFEYAGRTVLISGDTRVSANLERHATGVDLLVHEALSARLVAVLENAAAKAGDPILVRVMQDIPGYHTTPVEAAGIAARAGASALLFYHIVPALALPGLERIFLDGVEEAFGGRVILGEDGLLVSLQGNTQTIAVRELL